MAIESDQIEVNRRENARLLAAGCGGQAKFAERIDRSPGQVNHFIGVNPTKNIGKRVARHIEQCFSKPELWLDKNHLDQSVDAVGADLLGIAEGLDRQHLIEYLASAASILSGADQVELAETILRNARESLP